MINFEEDLADCLRTLRKSPNPPQVHMKLVRAYINGTGCRLTADEVLNLVCFDESVSRVVISAAEEVNDLAEEEEEEAKP